jgi:hypothetical protein
MGARGLTLLGVPVMGGRVTRAQRVKTYLDALGVWTVDLRFNEASGNIVNYGIDGGVGTPANVTYGQTGQLGANEAYSFNGTTSVVAIANAAVPLTKALTAQRWVFLVKPVSAGESNIGALLYWSNSESGGVVIRFAGATVLRASFDAGTDAVAQTNAGQVDFINSWALVFVDFDPANALGLGAKLRIFRATAASAVALLTLATDTAAIAPLVEPSGPLNIGNNTAGSATFDGLIDFVRGGAGLWSPDGAPTDKTRMEGLRSIVFNVP